MCGLQESRDQRGRSCTRVGVKIGRVVKTCRRISAEAGQLLVRLIMLRGCSDLYSEDTKDWETCAYDFVAL
jgi:hypothetical protein